MVDDRPNDDAEIAAIFTRLKSEVRRRPTAADSRALGDGDRAPLPARSQAEHAWAVTAERPFEHPPTRRGLVRDWFVSPVKRVLRKLMRWYVEPVATDQRTFNLAVLQLVDELAERTEEDVRRLERRLEELEGRAAGKPVERRE
jgi:hypothetical protein